MTTSRMETTPTPTPTTFIIPAVTSNTTDAPPEVPHALFARAISQQDADTQIDQVDQANRNSESESEGESEGEIEAKLDRVVALTWHIRDLVLVGKMDEVAQALEMLPEGFYDGGLRTVSKAFAEIGQTRMSLQWIEKISSPVSKNLAFWDLVHVFGEAGKFEQATAFALKKMSLQGMQSDALEFIVRAATKAGNIKIAKEVAKLLPKGIQLEAMNQIAKGIKNMRLSSSNKE